MKKLSLHERESISIEDNDVCAGELINCLHNLKELKLRLNISPEMKSKLRIRADAVGCKVVIRNMNSNVAYVG